MIITRETLGFNACAAMAVYWAKIGDAQEALYWACQALGHANRMKDQRKVGLVLSAIHSGRKAIEQARQDSIKAAWQGNEYTVTNWREWL